MDLMDVMGLSFGVGLVQLPVRFYRAVSFRNYPSNTC
jgi:hypothetical protein